VKYFILEFAQDICETNVIAHTFTSLVYSSGYCFPNISETAANMTRKLSGSHRTPAC